MTAAEYTQLHRALWRGVANCDCGDDLRVILPNRSARRRMNALEIYQATKEVHCDGCAWSSKKEPLWTMTSQRR